MKNYKFEIKTGDIIRGGKIHWIIKTKERLYNGRIKIIALLVVCILSLYYYPIISYILIGLFIGVFIIDYVLDLIKYKELADLHIINQPNKFYLKINKMGFSLSFTKDGKNSFIYLWESYDYFIDVEQKNCVILVGKDGSINTYFKSWMSNEAFCKLKEMTYKRIRRKLSERFS